MAAELSSTLKLEEGEEYFLRASGDWPLYDVNSPYDAQVIEWRAECFKRAGLESLDATALAMRRDVDRERVLKLLAAGCSHSCLLEILL